MRIVYNLNCVRAPMTGVAYYTVNMVSAMLRHYPDLDIIGFYENTLLSKEDILRLFLEASQPLKNQNHWKKWLIQMINRSFLARSFIQWHKALKHSITLKSVLKQSIYHEPNFVFLPHTGKKILTVHDTSMFDCPEYLPQGRAKFLRKEMWTAIQKSDALIVSCQFIKKQVLKLAAIDEKKIHVISPGAHDNFRPRTSEETYHSLEKFSLHYREFLLCVATLEPRKNLKQLVNAYRLLPPDLQQQFPLVLVGSKGWMYEELLSQIQENTIGKILLLRYVDEKTLLDLYSSAKAFIYPSLYEGFGLPVLEAMQSGLPVITSNVSSLPEVCGDAGILIDPMDANAIALAIETLLQMHNTDYHALVEQSLAQSRQFSWNDFAKQLFSVYEAMATVSE